MLMCEACGLQLFEHALHCPRCGRAVSGAELDASEVPAPPNTPPIRFEGEPAPAAEPAPAVEAGPALVPGDHGDDWDPDETSRFLPAYGSGRSTRNTVALIALGVALVAAISSLAWLIGQTLGTRPTVASPGTVSPSSTVLSSTPPRGATVCTPELARSATTTCAVATRVLSAVRTLGTDLPDSFRVTIADPQSRKNVTYLCAIKSWIECNGPAEAKIYVRRQA
ncbi:MAG: hypothetical protein QM582_03360 [Micropruina sp.]|uniref:hypothetical protein n=1 Tax=Micropruina sp. TaxID=2737536 RepID=UPI0039E6EC33